MRTAPPDLPPPPLALRVLLVGALVLELAGFAAGLVSLFPLLRDAAGAPEAVVRLAVLRFSLVPLALHLLLAAITLGAVLSVRRAPWRSVVLALLPLLLVFRFVAAGNVGLSFSSRHARFASETLLAVLTGATVHTLLAGAACALAIAGVLFGLFRTRAAERA